MGCRIPKAVIIDQWNPEGKQVETFYECPKSYILPNVRPTRQIPVCHSNGIPKEEENWFDEGDVSPGKRDE